MLVRAQNCGFAAFQLRSARAITIEFDLAIPKRAHAQRCFES